MRPNVEQDIGKEKTRRKGSTAPKPDSSPGRRLPFWALMTLLAVCLVLGLVWKFTSLHDTVGLATFQRWASDMRGHSWAPVAIAAIYAVSSLFVFVHVVLLWATVLAFDPWHAFVYCQIGTMASGLTTYGLGRLARPEIVQRIAGSYLDRVGRSLARRGRRNLILLHWFPICPFSILNFLAGATHISLRDFVIGTLVGCTPGLVLLAFYGHQISSFVHHRKWTAGTTGAIILAFLLIGAVLWRRHVDHHANHRVET